MSPIILFLLLLYQKLLIIIINNCTNVNVNLLSTRSSPKIFQLHSVRVSSFLSISQCSKRHVIEKKWRKASILSYFIVIFGEKCNQEIAKSVKFPSLAASMTPTRIAALANRVGVNPTVKIIVFPLGTPLLLFRYVASTCHVDLITWSRIQGDSKSSNQDYRYTILG